MSSAPIANCTPCREWVKAHPWGDPGSKYPRADGEARHHDSPYASPIQCAFGSNGDFTTDNWNCKGLDPLRDDARQREVWAEDQHAAVIRHGDCDFVLLTYSKHHGRTEGAWLIHGSELRPLRLSDIDSRVESVSL